MNADSFVYNSCKIKKPKQIAVRFSKTVNSLYRYLAYRDVPALISKYVKGKYAIDYGSGTGFSTQFIKNQGFNVLGLEICQEMFGQAKKNFPYLNFKLIKDGIIPCSSESIDFIFSSFVLFEMSSRDMVEKYLREVSRALKNDGIFIAITGNEELYKRDWLCINVNFPENKFLKSGQKARLALPDEGLEFIDFFWDLKDYNHFFKSSGLTILERHFPLGNIEEPYPWKDERKYAPYVIFIARKTIVEGFSEKDFSTPNLEPLLQG